MRRTLLSLFVVAVLAGGVGACGSSKGSGPSSGAGAAAAITIDSAFRFTARPVKAGATVTVRNSSAATHTVTSDTAGLFDTGNIGAGATATFSAPSAPGTYAFHCAIHSTTMMATLVVQ